MAITWQSHGNHVAITWQSRGNHMAITWQTHGKHMAITWQSHGNHMPRSIILPYVQAIINNLFFSAMAGIDLHFLTNTHLDTPFAQASKFGRFWRTPKKDFPFTPGGLGIYDFRYPSLWGVRQRALFANGIREVLLQAPPWLFAAESDSKVPSVPTMHAGFQKLRSPGRVSAGLWGAYPPPSVLVHFVCAAWPGSGGRMAAMELWGKWYAADIAHQLSGRPGAGKRGGVLARAEEGTEGSMKPLGAVGRRAVLGRRGTRGSASVSDHLERLRSTMDAGAGQRSGIARSGRGGGRGRMLAARDGNVDGGVRRGRGRGQTATGGGDAHLNWEEAPPDSSQQRRQASAHVGGVFGFDIRLWQAVCGLACAVTECTKRGSSESPPLQPCTRWLLDTDHHAVMGEDFLTTHTGGLSHQPLVRSARGEHIERAMQLALHARYRERYGRLEQLRSELAVPGAEWKLTLKGLVEQHAHVPFRLIRAAAIARTTHPEGYVGFRCLLYWRYWRCGLYGLCWLY